MTMTPGRDQGPNLRVPNHRWKLSASVCSFVRGMVSHRTKETFLACRKLWANVDGFLEAKYFFTLGKYPKIDHFYGQQGTCHLGSICTEYLPGRFQAEECPGVAVHFCNTPHMWAKPTAEHILSFSWPLLSRTCYLNLWSSRIHLKCNFPVPDTLLSF